MTGDEFLIALVEQRMGDAAAMAISVLERAKGGMQCLSVDQAGHYVGALRALDQLYRSVNHVVLPESLSGGYASSMPEKPDDQSQGRA